VQASDVAVELRPREAYEAADLGAALWRTHWWSAQRAWLVTFVPIAVGIGVGFRNDAFFAMLLVWWLAPLFERGPVYVLGRAVFGARTSFAEFVAALPRLGRGLWWRLSFARLSPWRAFVAPIQVLEQTRGAAARKRADALMAGGQESSAALAVAFTALAMQFALGISAYLLLLMLAPPWLSEQLDDQVSIFATEDGAAMWPGVLLYTLWCLAACVVGPLHAASGFALYLNRRMFLEGWDVEVAFRALATRLTSGVRRSAGVLVFVGLVGALFITSAPSVFAQDVEPSTQAADTAADSAVDANTRADEILARPEFSRTRTIKVPKFDDSKFDSGFEGSGLLALLEPLVYTVLVAAGIALVVALFVMAARWRGKGPDSTKSGALAPPVEVAGLDVRPESLPDDPATVALALWRRGEVREALGLLYRAAIAKIARAHLVPIADGDTEERCLERVLAHGERVPGAAFSALTRAWQALAYGRVAPADDEFERLCRDFRRDFGGAT
jgi:hypothetical protein